MNTKDLLPFALESAIAKVQQIEQMWNYKNPLKISEICAEDVVWRDQTSFINGRNEVIKHLTKKWEVEKNSIVKIKLWGFRGYRMAVQIVCEFQDKNNQWFRAYGNELLEFEKNGLLYKRFAAINNLKIEINERELE